MRPWLIKCAGGRKFVIYAWSQPAAAVMFAEMMPREHHAVVEAHTVEPTIAFEERSAEAGS